MLDVACGSDALKLAAARAVGPSGAVLGTDLSAGMLALARDAAAWAGAPQPATAAEDRDVAAALGRLRRAFALRPQAAVGEDAWATATVGQGVECRIAGPQGQHVRTDMPATAGGAEAAPTPGWYLRAAMAACTATVVKMCAVEEGIALALPEVTVRSRSDKRGLLGMDDVSVALDGLCTEIRLAAHGVPREVLEGIAQRAQRQAPVASTLAAARGAGGLTVEVVG